MNNPHLIERCLGAKPCAATWHVNYLLYITTSSSTFYYPDFPHGKVGVGDVTGVAHIQLIRTEAGFAPQAAGFRPLVYLSTSNTRYTNAQDRTSIQIKAKSLHTKKVDFFFLPLLIFAFGLLNTFRRCLTKNFNEHCVLYHINRSGPSDLGLLKIPLD